MQIGKTAGNHRYRRHRGDRIHRSRRTGFSDAHAAIIPDFRGRDGCPDSVSRSRQAVAQAAIEKAEEEIRGIERIQPAKERPTVV